MGRRLAMRLGRLLGRQRSILREICTTCANLCTVRRFARTKTSDRGLIQRCGLPICAKLLKLAWRGLLCGQPGTNQRAQGGGNPLDRCNRGKIRV